MITMLKSFFAPLLAITILTMGAGLLNSLLGVNMSLYGYSEQVIGGVMSCNYVGITLGIFFCQPVVQRVGHIRAFAIFAALMTAVALLHGIDRRLCRERLKSNRANLEVLAGLDGMTHV